MTTPTPLPTPGQTPEPSAMPLRDPVQPLEGLPSPGSTALPWPNAQDPRWTDPPERDKPRWTRKLMELGAGLLFGVPVGVLMARADWPGQWHAATGGLPVWAAFLLLPLAFWVAMKGVTTLHELGHWCAGRWAGMRPMTLMVGRLRMDWQDGRGQVSWHPMGMPGGLMIMEPAAKQGPAARRGLMLYMSGGVLANAATAFLAGLAAWSSAGWGQPLWGMVAIFAAFQGVLNLLPLRMGGFRTDGLRLKGLLQERPDTLVELALERLMKHSMAGQRHRDWDMAPLHALLRQHDGLLSTDVILPAQLLLATQALDADDRAAAAPHQQAVVALLHDSRLATVPKLLQSGYFLPVAAWLAEAGTPDALAASQRWLDAAGKPLMDAWAADLVRAQLQAARQDWVGMSASLDQVEAAWPRAVDQGSVPGARELATRLRAQAAAHASAPHPEATKPLS